MYFVIIPWGPIIKLPHRRFLQLAAGAAALPAVSRIARAQTYPTPRLQFALDRLAGRLLIGPRAELRVWYAPDGKVRTMSDKERKADSYCGSDHLPGVGVPQIVERFGQVLHIRSLAGYTIICSNLVFGSDSGVIAIRRTGSAIP